MRQLSDVLPLDFKFAPRTDLIFSGCKARVQYTLRHTVPAVGSCMRKLPLSYRIPRSVATPAAVKASFLILEYEWAVRWQGKAFEDLPPTVHYGYLFREGMTLGE